MRSGAATKVAMAVMIGCALVVMLDNTIITVALPTIGRDFSLTTSQMQWLVDGYTVVFAGTLLTAGALADRYGKLRVLVAGIVLFTVTSAVIPAASSFLELTTGRAVLGLAAAMVYPPTLGLVVDLATRGAATGEVDARRGQALALWATAGGLGVALGPVVGGLLVEHYGWRSVFVMNIPLGVLALVALFLVRRVVDAPQRDRGAPIGLASAVMSVIAVGAVVLAIVEAPVDGWTSKESLLRYVIAYGAVATFVAQQRFTERPIVPWWVFRRDAMRWGSAVIFLCFGLLFGLVFILVLYFQIVRGASAPVAGAMLLPFAAGMAFMSPVGPKLARAFGWRAPMAAGLAVMAGGFALFALTPWQGSYWVYPFISLLVIGVGFAVVQVPATECVMNSVAPSQFGIGSAVNDTSRELGGALGVAVLGSLFSTVFADKLNAPDRIDPMTLLLGPGGATAGGDRDAVLRDAFLPAMQTCVVVAVCAAGVAGAAIALSGLRRGASAPVRTPEIAVAVPAGTVDAGPAESHAAAVLLATSPLATVVSALKGGADGAVAVAPLPDRDGDTPVEGTAIVETSPPESVRAEPLGVDAIDAAPAGDASDAEPPANTVPDDAAPASGAPDEAEPDGDLAAGAGTVLAEAALVAAAEDGLDAKPPRVAHFQRWRPPGSAEPEPARSAGPATSADGNAVAARPDIASDDSARRVRELQLELERTRLRHAEEIGRLRADNEALKEGTVALGRVLGYWQMNDARAAREHPDAP